MRKIIGKIIVLVVIVALLAVFIPRLVHKCDDCEKVFFGTGYEPNVLSEILSEDDQIICKECAEKQHALSIAMGKTLNDFKKPLF